eukprot:gene5355-7106_t
MAERFNSVPPASNGTSSKQVEHLLDDENSCKRPKLEKHLDDQNAPDLDISSSMKPMQLKRSSSLPNIKIANGPLHAKQFHTSSLTSFKESIRHASRNHLHTISPSVLSSLRALVPLLASRQHRDDAAATLRVLLTDKSTSPALVFTELFIDLIDGLDTIDPIIEADEMDITMKTQEDMTQNCSTQSKSCVTDASAKIYSSPGVLHEIKETIDFMQGGTALTDSDSDDSSETQSETECNYSIPRAFVEEESQNSNNSIHPDCHLTSYKFGREEKSVPCSSQQKRKYRNFDKLVNEKTQESEYCQCHKKQSTCAAILVHTALYYRLICPLIVEALGAKRLLKEIYRQNDEEAAILVSQQPTVLRYLVESIITSSHQDPYLLQLLRSAPFAEALARTFRTDDLVFLKEWIKRPSYPLDSSDPLRISSTCHLLSQLALVFPLKVLSHHLSQIQPWILSYTCQEELADFFVMCEALANQSPAWKLFLIRKLGIPFFVAHLESRYSGIELQGPCCSFLRTLCANNFSIAHKVALHVSFPIYGSLLNETFRQSKFQRTVLDLLEQIVSFAPLKDSDIDTLCLENMMDPNLEENVRSMAVSIFSKLQKRGFENVLVNHVIPKDWFRLFTDSKKIDLRQLVLQFLISMPRSLFVDLSQLRRDVEPIVSKLLSSPPSLQTDIITFLRHLASGHEDRKNTVFALVNDQLKEMWCLLDSSRLKSSNRACSEAARELLAFFKCMTSTEGPRKKAIFDSLHIDRITQLLFDSSDINVQEQAAGFLRNLTHGDNQRKQIIFDKLPKSLSPLLTSNSSRVVQSVAGLLQNLCTRSEERREKVFEQISLDEIVHLLKSSDPHVKAPAAGLLMNLCRTDNRRKLAILKEIPLCLLQTFYMNGTPPRPCREQVHGLMQHLTVSFVHLVNEGIILNQPGYPTVKPPQDHHLTHQNHPRNHFHHHNHPNQRQHQQPFTQGHAIPPHHRQFLMQQYRPGQRQTHIARRPVQPPMHLIPTRQDVAAVVHPQLQPTVRNSNNTLNLPRS